MNLSANPSTAGLGSRVQKVEALSPLAPTVLLVESDPRLASLITIHLSLAGIPTAWAHDALTASSIFRLRRPALLIVDLEVVENDRWDECLRLIRQRDVPFLFLTGGSSTAAVLAQNTMDCVRKPIDPGKLVARVGEVIRLQGRVDPAARVLAHGNLVVDAARMEVTVANRAVPLTRSELLILEALVRAPGRVFTREQLLRTIHPGGGVVVDRVIDVHVSNLRRKLEARSALPDRIQTVRGVGYRLNDQPVDSIDAKRRASRRPGKRAVSLDGATGHARRSSRPKAGGPRKGGPAPAP